MFITAMLLQATAVASTPIPLRRAALAIPQKVDTPNIPDVSWEVRAMRRAELAEAKRRIERSKRPWWARLWR
ncbi:MAG TPA: hypothetical protein VF628_14700 [Allosphingosinicella sp.]|jgi:hypothetical protein